LPAVPLGLTAPLNDTCLSDSVVRRCFSPTSLFSSISTTGASGDILRDILTPATEHCRSAMSFVLDPSPVFLDKRRPGNCDLHSRRLRRPDAQGIFPDACHHVAPNSTSGATRRANQRCSDAVRDDRPVTFLRPAYAPSVAGAEGPAAEGAASGSRAFTVELSPWPPLLKRSLAAHMANVTCCPVADRRHD
jgi:hypothetical protein